MKNLFIKSFFRNLRTNRDITILLCVGLFVSIYTLCTLLGAAMGEYQLALQGNDTATLTVDVSKEHFDPDQWNAALQQDIPGGTINTVCITKTGLNQFVIGWDGNRPDMWFPSVYGRFFTQEEQENAAEVIYTSESIGSEEQMISFDGRDYALIGKGSLVNATFGVATSLRSQHVDFWRNYTSEYRFYVLPYRTYIKSYVPDMVLIQLKNGTSRNLKTARQNLQQSLSGTQVFLPNTTASEVLIKSNVKYALLSVGLSLLAFLTIIMISQEWLQQFKEELSVYYLCGLPSGRCVTILYVQYLILYLVSTIAALLLHFFSRPILSLIYADAAPNPITFVLMLVLLFLFVVLCTVGGIKKVLTELQRRAD